MHHHFQDLRLCCFRAFPDPEAHVRVKGDQRAHRISELRRGKLAVRIGSCARDSELKYSASYGSNWSP